MGRFKSIGDGLLDLSQITRNAAPAFASMTFPAFRPLLLRAAPESDVVAVGAWRRGIPIGLGLGRILPGEASEALSIFVAAGYRRADIATKLLTRLQQLLAERGCKSCELVYMTEGASTVALERLLEKCGWPPSQLRMMVFKFDRTIMQARWIHACKLPPAFEVFFWTDLTSAERLALCRSQEEQKWIPEYLVPFQYERDMDASNSLGLRWRGDVVGWVITHRIAVDTVRYTSLFVRQDLQRAGRGILLLAESIRIQARELGLDSFGICSVRPNNKAMLTFLQRHAPSASVRETRGTRKSLTPGAAQKSS